MARYFFDIHGSGLAEWDDVGIECRDNAELELHTRRLLHESIDQPDAAAYGAQVISATVHLEGDGVVLTAVAKPNAPVQIMWAKP